MKIAIYVWSIDDEDANFKLIKTTFNQKIKPRNTDIIVDDGFFCWWIFLSFAHTYLFHIWVDFFSTQKPTVPDFVHINIAILSSHVHKLILYNFVYLVVKKITCCLPNALYYIMVFDTAKTILLYLLKNEETILNYITR